MGPRIIPKNASFWPEDAVGIDAVRIRTLYENWFAGAYKEPEEEEAFEEQVRTYGGNLDGGQVAMDNGFADDGADLLSIPFVWILIHFPGCLPGAAQERGDCVSHDQKNANLLSYACEIQDGQPDTETGKIEIAPEIPERGLKTGAFSSCPFYWFRRHSGDGWSCQAAAKVAMREAGLVTCDNHPELGVDLTTYSAAKAGKYGRTPPSGEIADALDNHLIRQATNVRDREQRRAYSANGYGQSSCGGEGFGSTRNQHGVSGRRGGWNHAFPVAFGFDDRLWCHKEYGQSLELCMNSWGIWNRGPRDIVESAAYVASLYDTVKRVHGVLTNEQAHAWLINADIVNQKTGNIMVPHGAFWAKSGDLDRRTVIAKSSVNGWPARRVALGLAGEV